MHHYLDKLDEKTGRNVHHDVGIYDLHLRRSGGGDSANIQGQDRYNTMNHHHPLCSQGSQGHTMDHHVDKLDEIMDRNVRHDDVEIHDDAGIDGGGAKI